LHIFLKALSNPTTEPLTFWGKYEKRVLEGALI
jgi:hypothetical protein